MALLHGSFAKCVLLGTCRRYDFVFSFYAVIGVERLSTFSLVVVVVVCNESRAMGMSSKAERKGGRIHAITLYRYGLEMDGLVTVYRGAWSIHLSNPYL